MSINECNADRFAVASGMYRAPEILPCREQLDEFAKRIATHQMLPPIGYYAYNRDWYIDDNGNLWHITDYGIEVQLLDNEDWVLHLMQHSWFDANTFIPAYFEACTRAGIQSVVMKTTR